MPDAETYYEFTPNQTLDRALRRVFWRKGVKLRDRINIRQALRDDLLREEIEFSLTAKAMDMGAIPPQSSDVTQEGIYVGNYITNLLDWIIENWDSILEMILAIISLFLEEE